MPALELFVRDLQYVSQEAFSALDPLIKLIKYIINLINSHHENNSPLVMSSMLTNPLLSMQLTTTVP